MASFCCSNHITAHRHAQKEGRQQAECWYSRGGKSDLHSFQRFTYCTNSSQLSLHR